MVGEASCDPHDISLRACSLSNYARTALICPPICNLNRSRGPSAYFPQRILPALRSQPFTPSGPEPEGRVGLLDPRSWDDLSLLEHIPSRNRNNDFGSGPKEALALHLPASFFSLAYTLHLRSMASQSVVTLDSDSTPSASSVAMMLCAQILQLKPGSPWSTGACRRLSSTSAGFLIYAINTRVSR